MARIAALSAVLLLALLSGCGFQLRGDLPLPEAMERTYLLGSGNSALHYELEDRIRLAGGQLVTNRDEASGTLQIHSQRFDRRNRGVDARGRTNSYEYRQQLVFSLYDQTGKTIADREQINLYREQRFNPDQVLAMGEERDMLQEEMRRQAIDQMLRRLQALARQHADAQTD